MLGHRSACFLGIADTQGLDNRQMFAGLLSEPAIIVSGFVVFPGHVAEGPEQHLQAANFLGQKRIATRFGNGIVQPGVEAACFDDQFRPRRASGFQCA